MRYFGNRFSSLDLRLFILIIVLNIVVIIGGILTVELLIPFIVQKQVDKTVDSLLAGKEPTLLRNLKAKIALGEFTATTIPVKVAATADPPTILPGYANIGPISITPKLLQANGPEIVLAESVMDPFTLVFNGPLNMDGNLLITVNDDKQRQINDMMKQLSSKGFQGAVGSAQMTFPLKFLGIPIYRAFPLAVNIPIGDVPNKVDVPALVALVKKNRTETNIPASVSNAQKELASRFKPSQIISIAPGFDLAISKLNIIAQDPGIRVETGLTFSLPDMKFAASLKKVAALEGYGAVSGSRAVHFSFENIGLTTDPLQNMDIAMNANFIDSLISPNISGNIAEIGIAGPLKATNAAFSEKASQDLNMGIKLPPFAPEELLKNIDFGGLLGKFSFTNVILGAQKSSVDVSLKMDSMPIPAFDFPYNGNLDAFHQDKPLGTFGMSGVRLESEGEGSRLTAKFNAVNLNVIQGASFLLAVVGLSNSSSVPLSMTNFDLNDGQKQFEFIQRLPIKKLTFDIPTDAIKKMASSSFPSILSNLNIQALLQSISISDLIFTKNGVSNNFAVDLPFSLKNSADFPYTGGFTLGTGSKVLSSIDASKLKLTARESNTRFSSFVHLDQITLDSVAAGAGLLNSLFKLEPISLSVSKLKVGDGKESEVLSTDPFTFEVPTAEIVGHISKIASGINPLELLKKMSLSISDIQTSGDGGSFNARLALPALANIEKIELPFTGGIDLWTNSKLLASNDVSKVTVVGSKDGLVVNSNVAINRLSLDSMIGGASVINSIITGKSASVSASQWRAGDGSNSVQLPIDRVELPIPSSLFANLNSIDVKNAVPIKELLSGIKLTDINFEGSTGSGLLSVTLPSLGDFKAFNIPISTGLELYSQKGLITRSSANGLFLSSSQKGAFFSTNGKLENITIDSVVAGAVFANGIIQGQPTELSVGAFFARDSERSVTLPIDRLSFTLPANIGQMALVMIGKTSKNIDIAKIASSLRLSNTQITQNGITTGVSLSLPALVDVKNVNLPFGIGFANTNQGKKLVDIAVSKTSLTGNQKSISLKSNIAISGLSMDTLIAGAPLLNSVLKAQPLAVGVTGFSISDEEKKLALPLNDFNFPLDPTALKDKVNPAALADMLLGVKITSISMGPRGPQFSFKFGDHSKGGESVKLPVNFGAKVLAKPGEKKPVSNVVISEMTAATTKNGLQAGLTMALNDITMDSAVRFSPIVGRIIGMKNTTLPLTGFSVINGNSETPLALDDFNGPIPSNFLEQILKKMMSQEGSKLLQNINISNVQVSLPNLSARIQVKMPGENMNLKIPASLKVDSFKGDAQIATVNIGNITIETHQGQTTAGLDFALQPEVSLEAGGGFFQVVGQLISGNGFSVSIDNVVAKSGKETAKLPIGRQDLTIPGGVIGEAFTGLLKQTFGL